MTTNELQVTSKRAVAIWWAFVWRGVVFCSIPAFILGFVIGFAGAVVHADKVITARISGFTALAVSIPVGIWIVKTVLSKKFKDFRIALLPIENSNQI